MKNFKFKNLLLLFLLTLPMLTACSDDKDDEPSSSTPSIVGTWECDYSDDSFIDVYTLVFDKDGTGYISNTFVSRSTDQMNFDWSLTSASDGTLLLSVIYTSGDRDMDGPFKGGYAQYNLRVTIAGSTLSISGGNSTVMLFKRK